MSKDRRFSLDDDFMNYSIDDLLYGAMQYLATFHPAKEKIYLTKQNLMKNKKVLYTMCNLDSRKLKAHIQKLIDKELIKEEEIECGGNSISAYTFPYDYDGGYQLINYEMLWYLVSTRSRFAIQVYVYLLNKYLWKAQTEEDYIFTNKELQVALGYSKDSNLAGSAITNVLESLSREGIIKFVDEWQDMTNPNGNQSKTCRHRLVFIAQTKEDLQK